MKRQHTPGPWQYFPQVAYPAGVIDQVPSLQHIAKPEYSREHLDETKANGFLIAAAPELLDALEDALQEMEETLFDDPYPEEMIHLPKRIEKAKAAIKKAKGEF